MHQLQFTRNFLLKLWLFSGIIIGLLLSSISNVVMTIEMPAALQNEGVRVILNKGGKQIILAKQNDFIFSIPFGFPQTVSSNLEIESSLQISKIQIKNVFGGTVLDQAYIKNTKLSEILKTARYVNLDVNSEFEPTLSNRWQLFIKCLIAGEIIALLAITALLIINFIFKLVIDLSVGILAPVVLKFDDTRIGNKPVYILSTVILIAITGFSCILSYCGIMHSDEGFYLLMAKYPQDVISSGANTQYYQFTRHLYSLSHDNIPLFRFCTLGLNFISIVILTYSFKIIFEYLFSESLSKLRLYLIFIILYIASCFQFIHHITPDYNNLSRYIVFLQLPLLIILVLNLVQTSSKRYLLIFLLGSISGFNFFIKAPEFITSLILIISLLVLVRQNFLKSLIFLFAGISFSFLFYFIFLQSPLDFISVSLNTMHIDKLVGAHNPVQLLLNNFIDIISLLIQIVVIIGLYNYLTKPLAARYPRNIILLSCIIIIIIAGGLSLIYQVKLMPYFALLSKILLTISGLIFFENIRNYSGLDFNQAKELNE